MAREKQRRVSGRLPAPRKAVEPTGSPGQFRATTSDAEMLFRLTRAEQPGFDDVASVRVTLKIRAIEGHIEAPSLLIDWGDGLALATPVALKRLGEDAYVVVAHTNAGALSQIVLRPSAAPCLFELTAFQVEPAAEPAPGAPRLSAPRRLLRAALRGLSPGAARAIRISLRTLRDPKSTIRLARQTIRNRRLDPWRESYQHAFNVARHAFSPHYAAPALNPPPRADDAPRVLAFYLPQYHPFPENDQWWGKGFTEWTNVSKATPQFVGHYQPRLPGELGFYDLRVPEVLQAQARMARNAGVDAFCFHYYWFGGKRLLERPLDAFVADPEIDLPFALCWANENWTRRWDGDESDVLMAQDHSPEDDLALLDDLARYMASPRYVRVGGKPLLIVYRPDTLPDAAATLERWRKRARELGIGELFILCTNAFGFSAYRDAGFDGLVEFPPHALQKGEITDTVERLNLDFAGRVYDYDAVVEERIEALERRADPRIYPGVMPSWDNEARKPGCGNIFHNATPQRFHDWAGAALDCTTRLAPPDERLVFVNAWNEWGEGTYARPVVWPRLGPGPAQRRRPPRPGPRARSPRRRRLAPEPPAPRRRDAVPHLLCRPDRRPRPAPGDTAGRHGRHHHLPGAVAGHGGGRPGYGRPRRRAGSPAQSRTRRGSVPDGAGDRPGARPHRLLQGPYEEVAAPVGRRGLARSPAGRPDVARARAGGPGGVRRGPAAGPAGSGKCPI
ncbi:MAG: hypothetical protein B7Z44_12530 [Caulobacter sp. 12-67-6]|nr:MAG: hypothetical protein B7Z44_12530 [Caulobacter sp. 12-67-6]